MPVCGKQEVLSCGFLGLTAEGSISFRKFNKLCKWEKEYVSSVQSEFRGCAVMEPDESISGILEEISFADTMAELEDIVGTRDFNKVVEVKLYSTEMYELIIEFERTLEEVAVVRVDTKYKTVAKKVKPVAAPLPKDSDGVLERVSKEHILRDPSKIGHTFTKETLEQLKIGGEFLTEVEVTCFKEMIVKHGRAFLAQ